MTVTANSVVAEPSTSQHRLPHARGGGQQRRPSCRVREIQAGRGRGQGLQEAGSKGRQALHRSTSTPSARRGAAGGADGGLGYK